MSKSSRRWNIRRTRPISCIHLFHVQTYCCLRDSKEVDGFLGILCVFFPNLFEKFYLIEKDEISWDVQIFFIYLFIFLQYYILDVYNYTILSLCCVLFVFFTLSNSILQDFYYFNHLNIQSLFESLYINFVNFFHVNFIFVCIYSEFLIFIF